MFKGNFVLIGLDWLTETQLDTMFSVGTQQLRYVTEPGDINADFHEETDVTYVVNLSKISSYASDILAKIAKFYGTKGVSFVVIVTKKPPKLIKKMKFKTLELRCG